MMNKPLCFIFAGRSWLINSHWDLVGLRTSFGRSNLSGGGFVNNLLVFGVEISWFKRS